MPRKSTTRKTTREELEQQLAAVTRATARTPTRRVAPVEQRPNVADRVSYSPADLPEPPAGYEPFGAWLIAQRDRGDWIDALAAAARADAGFPRRGSPDDVRRRLQAVGADGDAFEQVDDAERHWSGR